MPYEYRRMSAEEREAVMQQRRAAGYPLHAPPHFMEEGGRFLLTAANFEHKPIMASPQRRTDFEGRLLTEMRSAGVAVYAWVVLTNHYHVLVGAPALIAPLKVIQHVHGSTSRAWNLTDEETHRRRVWYQCTDRMIRNESHFQRALNYLHYNPIKHGYVEDAYEWPWSSLEAYRESRGREWLQAMWRSFPPDHFGLGWDD